MPSDNSVVVIPARLESTRLPRKVLADICGWPMIRHVYERCKQAELPSKVVVATDSEEVAANVIAWSGNVVMTSADCTCGTERIASIVEQLDADIVVNVQGDEPLIAPGLVDQLVRTTVDTGADMVIPVRRITSLEVLMSPTAVKAVLGREGDVLYFSRSAVPFIRDVEPKDWLEYHDFWVVVGTASFRKQALLEYRTWPEDRLEQLEKIEQLRFLAAGKRIATIQTEMDSIAVDVPEDLERARRLIAESLSSLEGHRA